MPTPLEGRKPPKRLPHGNVLGLVFSEFVAVQAVREFAGRRGQRQNRNLHHVVTLREPVDQAQRIGMHQVFGIVDRDDFEAHVPADFEGLQMAVNLVQAIALGGGAGVRAPGQMHARIAGASLGDGARR